MNVDVDERGSATIDEDATSVSPGSRIGVDSTRQECDRAASDIDTTAICYDIGAAADVSVDVDVDKCCCSTIDENATSLCALPCQASRDVEPDHMHDARRARVDVQHTTRTRSACLCIQHDRACHRRLDYDAPGDAELGAEVVGAGGKDNAADGGVGE